MTEDVLTCLLYSKLLCRVPDHTEQEVIFSVYVLNTSVFPQLLAICQTANDKPMK